MDKSTQVANAPVRPTHANLRNSLALVLALVPALASAQSTTRSFWAEGADTGMGLGARYIAMGGVGTAVADDVYATYYNAAGLAEVKGLQLSMSRQLNARLHPFNFLGVAWQVPGLGGTGYRAGVSYAYYPRVHARASGAFTEQDFESVYLRYLLPGISGNFNGDVDSKTKSHRLAFGVASEDLRWSAGVYAEYIDCKTSFCGLQANSPGYTVSTTGAKALTWGAGLRVRPTPEWRLAAHVSDATTKLDVDQVITDSSGTRVGKYLVRFPARVQLEAANQWGPSTLLAMQYDLTRGQYGKTDLHIELLRFGMEHVQGEWQYRLGALAPIKISSTQSGTIKLPFPIAPTAGLGWRSGMWDVGLAIYAHPVMSAHLRKPAPTADLSVTLAFQ